MTMFDSPGMTSECRTWSHGLISSLGAQARGGVVRRRHSMSQVVRPLAGSGFDGLGWVPSGRVRLPKVHMGPYIKRTLMRGIQSSDPSRPVRSCRAISVSDGFPSEPSFGTTGPDGARGVVGLSHIGAQLTYRPIQEHLASPQALRGPVGTQRPSSGPPAALSDPSS